MFRSLFSIVFDHVMRNADNAADLMHVNDSGIELINPVGMREDDGNIVPINIKDKQQYSENNAMEIKYFGRQECVAQDLQQLVS